MRARRLPIGVIVAISVLFTGLPFVVAYLEGSLFRLLQDGTWRRLLQEPAIVLYSLAVAAWIFPSVNQVLEGLRPISKLNDDEYDRLVVRTTRISPRAEAFAIAIGAAFGLLLAVTGLDTAQPSALALYMLAANMVMFAVMSWGLYMILAESRRLAAFHRYPLRVNVFDIEPFEPIGRLSLQICLVYIGGIVISLVLDFSWTDILSWQNFLVYGLLIAVTIFLFFANMWRTHQVLSRAKQEALAAARRHIDSAYRTLEELSAKRENTQAVAAEISAWTTMEERLRLARTWPYNTEMLRTLFISALTPVLIAVVRLIGILLSD